MHCVSRQVITTEVQATLKGNQWPLSCFGPFKEKKNIPNFIEDVSFEECRLNAYEAGKQNMLQSYAQQFNQQIQDAQGKMNAILNLNKDIVDVIISLYEDEQSAPKPSAFSGGNSFGAVAPTAPGGSVFGGATSVPSTGGSMFGSGGTFGNNTAAPQGSVFGGALKQSSFGQQPSIFAAAQPAAPANPFASAFGQTTAQANTGGSIFGKPAATPAFGGSAFSAQPSIFGQSNQSQQGSIFGAQQPSQPQVNAFGTSPQQGSIFGTATLQPSQPQSSVFGTNAAQPQSSVFGTQPSAFGAQPTFGQVTTTPAPQLAASGGMFLQQQQQQQPAFGSSPFGAQPAAPLQQQAFNQTSVFAQTAQQPPQPSAFSQPQQTGFFGQQQNTVASPFGIQAGQPHTLQQQPQINPFTQQPQNAGTLNGTEYSRMEDLSPEDLAAFQAYKFEEGKIPTVPPPKELCGEWNF